MHIRLPEIITPASSICPAGESGNDLHSAAANHKQIPPIRTELNSGMFRLSANKKLGNRFLKTVITPLP